jgi:hypothetical protein
VRQWERLGVGWEKGMAAATKAAWVKPGRETLHASIALHAGWLASPWAAPRCGCPSSQLPLQPPRAPIPQPNRPPGPHLCWKRLTLTPATSVNSWCSPANSRSTRWVTDGGGWPAQHTAVASVA